MELRRFFNSWGRALTTKISIEGWNFKTMKKMKNIFQEWFLTDFHPKNRPGNLKIKSRPKI